jgi:hypothetical protein
MKERIVDEMLKGVKSPLRRARGKALAVRLSKESGWQSADHAVASALASGRNIWTPQSIRTAISDLAAAGRIEISNDADGMLYLRIALEADQTKDGGRA